MSAAVQDSGLAALRHQSICAPPGRSLQQPRLMLDVQSFPQLPKVHRTKEKKQKKNQGNSSRDGFIPRGLDSAKVNGFLWRPTLVTLNHSLKQWGVELLSIVQAEDRREPLGYQPNTTRSMERQRFCRIFFNGTLCMHVGMFNPPPNACC